MSNFTRILRLVDETLCSGELNEEGNRILGLMRRLVLHLEVHSHFHTSLTERIAEIRSELAVCEARLATVKQYKEKP